MSEGSIHIMFRSLTHEDALKRLPFWFGDGIDALEVNLSDATTGKRIRIPGRGVDCDHIDLVDVKNSTGATEAGEIEWMCPVCGREYTNTDQIEVDLLILDALKELNEDDEEETHRAINLYLDGHWTGVSENSESRLPMVRKKRLRLTLAEAKAAMQAREPVDLDSGLSESRSEDVIDLEDSD